MYKNEEQINIKDCCTLGNEVLQEIVIREDFQQQKSETTELLEINMGLLNEPEMSSLIEEFFVNHSLDLSFAGQPAKKAKQYTVEEKLNQIQKILAMDIVDLINIG